MSMICPNVHVSATDLANSSEAMPAITSKESGSHALNLSLEFDAEDQQGVIIFFEKKLVDGVFGNVHNGGASLMAFGATDCLGYCFECS